MTVVCQAYFHESENPFKDDLFACLQGRETEISRLLTHSHLAAIAGLSQLKPGFGN